MKTVAFIDILQPNLESNHLNHNQSTFTNYKSTLPLGYETDFLKTAVFTGSGVKNAVCVHQCKDARKPGLDFCLSGVDGKDDDQ